MHDLLNDRLIRIERGSGVEKVTLPGLLAALAKDEVRSIPAVRAHQRHTVHATFVQIAAIALHSAGRSDVPTDEGEWRDLIVAATPEPARDHAWHLVTPFDRPAFMQTADIPDFAAKGKSGKPAELARGPVDIDILVSSRNHDVKISEGSRGQADDWIMALISIQTQGGYDGRSNFGVTRMNGGLGSRSGFSLVPPGGQGASFRRDLLGHLALRKGMFSGVPYKASGGLTFTWTKPWDGTTSLSVEDLDPFYIETCRRLRLVETDGVMGCLVGNSAVVRIVSPFKGNMGDLWTVVAQDKEDLKAFTCDETGLNYRRMIGLMFGSQPKSGNALKPSPLSERLPFDPAEGLSFLGRAFVRGQGKTEGYHERKVPLSKPLSRVFGQKESDRYGVLARLMIEHASKVQNSCLASALVKLASGGVEELTFSNKGDSNKKDRWIVDYAQAIDARFFERFSHYCECIDRGSPESEAELDWLCTLYDIGWKSLDKAIAQAVLPSTNSLRAISRARGIYVATYRSNYPEAAALLWPKPSDENPENKDVDMNEKEVVNG